MGECDIFITPARQQKGDNKMSNQNWLFAYKDGGEGELLRPPNTPLPECPEPLPKENRLAR
jgi:hypothetical protein